MASAGLLAFGLDNQTKIIYNSNMNELIEIKKHIQSTNTPVNILKIITS